MQMSSLLVYRAGYVVAIVVLIAQLFLLTMVWRAIYADRGDVGGVSAETTTAYAALSLVQFTVFNPFRPSALPQRVREGKIAVDLLRPVNLPGQMIAGQLGSVAAMALATLPALPILLLIGSVPAPASSAAAVGYAVAFISGLVLNQLIIFLVNLVCLWTLEISGMMLIFRFVSQFLSGALLPVWLMPTGVRVLAESLPFQAVGYVPAAIFLGQISGPAILTEIVEQWIWIAALGGLVTFAWSRAKRRIISDGG
jgi:ABC-2 type transport system permease protein